MNRRDLLLALLFSPLSQIKTYTNTWREWIRPTKVVIDFSGDGFSEFEVRCPNKTFTYTAADIQRILEGE